MQLFPIAHLARPPVHESVRPKRPFSKESEMMNDDGNVAAFQPHSIHIKTWETLESERSISERTSEDPYGDALEEQRSAQDLLQKKRVMLMISDTGGGRPAYIHRMRIPSIDLKPFLPVVLPKQYKQLGMAGMYMNDSKPLQVSQCRSRNVSRQIFMPNRRVALVRAMPPS